jgi:hypothetical protein
MAKKRKTRPQGKARFPRLREIREQQLGWDIVDILTRLPGGRPSVASIYRLEQGHSVRISNARRIFNVINTALNNKLDPSKELIIE